MDQQKEPIIIHISLSKHTKYLLEKIAGIDASENSRKRIPWRLVLATMDEYLKEHQETRIIPRIHKKIGSTRKITIFHEAYPALYHYIDGLMKSQRTFKFECLLHSLENYIGDLDTPTYSFEEEGVASKSSQSFQSLCNKDDIEAPVSSVDSSSDKDFDSENANTEKDSEDNDIDEFLDFMDF